MSVEQTEAIQKSKEKMLNDRQQILFDYVSGLISAEKKTELMNLANGRHDRLLKGMGV